jgi:hypothetical protein
MTTNRNKDISNTVEDNQVTSILGNFFLLATAISYQLENIDDTEFMESDRHFLFTSKSRHKFNVNQIQHIMTMLKSVLYYFYWTSQYMSDLLSDGYSSSYDSSNMKSDTKHSIHNILAVQLVLICTKLYNQLSARNERLQFLPISAWHWDTLSPTDLMVIIPLLLIVIYIFLTVIFNIHFYLMFV